MENIKTQAIIYKEKKLINRKFFILLFIFGFIGTSAFSMDFYPELGADPFYSALNPEYIEKSDNEDNTSLINMIKNRKKENKIQKEIKIQNKSAQISEEKDKNAAEPEKTLFKKLFSDSKGNNEENSTLVTHPKKRPTVRELEKEERERERIENNEPTLKQKLQEIFSKKSKEQNEVAVIPDNPKIDISAEYMEYFPERYEVEAVGNAKIRFTQSDTILAANKIIFNYDTNILTASEDVVLLSKGSTTEGDFIRLDLNNPDGWIENPTTKTEDIILNAKDAFIYSDKIEEYDGVAKILKNEVIAYRADTFGTYVDQGGVLSQNNRNKQKPATGVYSLKARTIYIDSKKDHDIITIKNADLYLKKHKIASIPSTQIVSNKNNTVVESNVPEFGSQSSLGMYFGPAVVLNVPGGSTLKLAPILTYGNSRLGVGGIARFRNTHNMTEVAYGTSEDKLLFRGKQKILPGLTFDYSHLTNQNEWFMGYRRPKYSASLNYTRSDYIKDLKLTFSQMYSAGAYRDYGDDNIAHKGTEGRFRWMTQTYKNLYSFKSSEGNVGFNIGAVAQTAASAYTTGDVNGVFRFGPALTTNVGPWRQSAIYYISGIAGDTPFDFDRYRYGRSNVVLIESLKVCKYLTLGYLTSLSFHRDDRDSSLFQENRFLVSVGPEYVKLILGYDAFRNNTSFMLSMLVGSKDSEVEFKKTVIKNPQTLGKTDKKKKKPKKKNYKRFLKEKITPDTVL